MASAKFVEEVLRTDVDESEVNAIVGSLETQLVTSSPSAGPQVSATPSVNQNHVNSAISNGGTDCTQKQHLNGGATAGDTSVNIQLNDLNNKVNAVPASGYINQIQSSSNSSTTPLAAATSVVKHEPPIKLLYPNNSTPPTTTQVVGVNNNNNNNNNNNRFPTTLPNGNVNLVNSNSPAVSPAPSVQSAKVITSEAAKPVVINKPPPLSTVMTVPITTMAGAPGVVTLTQKIGNQTVVGPHPGAPTLLPANVQILNFNAMRPAAPGTPGQKGVPQRVVIGAPHLMAGARPGAPGQITLQALQQLQPGTQGHLLLKTENGQYQLLRVGSVAQNNPNPGAAITQGGPNTPTSGMPTTTYRLQTVPVSSAPRAVTPMQQHTMTVAAGTPTLVQSGVAMPGVSLAAQNAAAVAQRQAVDSTKEKCRKFLANLLELSSREPKQVEKNVRTLIQELIDTKVEPEEFCDRLERLLNASPQPCLIGFLKKSLPLLRQALITKELVIEGIKPPPPNVLFAQGSMLVPQLQGRVQPAQLRPVTTQVRVMAPGAAAFQRGVTTIQHRLVTPMGVRPHLNAAGKMPVMTSMSAGGAPVTMVAVRHPLPSTVAKPSTPAAKEKKTFSSSGYTGDDDINDVAAMGGVNLAEESQKILGSTEFVGTQIRSCKDDIFLNSPLLQQKIKQIMLKHGMDDSCSSDVTALVSHATQERLKSLVEKLAVIAEHRLDMVKMDPRYEVVQDVKTQLRFLEDLDRLERRRHEEQERELLLRAAKSRSKSEDPEQAKLKAKAKEMQRAEMEELRQREANLTALQAIGPRKKPKLDGSGTPGTSAASASAGPSGSSSSSSRSAMPLRPRVKRVILRDLVFLLEQEKETCRSNFLYKAYMK